MKSTKTLETHNRNSTRAWDSKTNEEIVRDINQDMLDKARKKIANMNHEDRQVLKASISWYFLPETLKKATREKIQARMKTIDLFCLLFAVIGIVSNLVATSMFIQFDSTQRIENGMKKISIEVKANSSETVDALRWITTISTVILILLIILHYKTRHQFYVFKQKLDVTSKVWKSHLMIYLVIEIFFCIIHTPPYLDTHEVDIVTTGVDSRTIKMNIDLILSMIIPLRVYLFIKYYSFYSPWADDKAEKICNECNTKGGFGFAIKAELKERPYMVIGILMTISILIFGYGLRNVEIAFVKDVEFIRFQDWRFVWNGFWCIIITILTIGFGDYYPQTHLGRFISVVACLWGTFLISLMVVSLTTSVEFTAQEERAYEELKRSTIQNKLKVKAIKLVRLGYRVKLAYESMKADGTPNTKIEYVKVYNEFKTLIDDFRVLRKIVASKEQEVSAEMILHKLNHNVTEQMENMIQLSNYHVTSLMDYIKLSKDIQSKIAENSDKLEKLVNGLYKCIN